jgi:hypothetical protein
MTRVTHLGVRAQVDDAELAGHGVEILKCVAHHKAA